LILHAKTTEATAKKELLPRAVAAGGGGKGDSCPPRLDQKGQQNASLTLSPQKFSD